MDRSAWELLLASDLDEPLVIEVDRLETASGRVFAGEARRTIRIARGSVYGAVYYWNLQMGEVRRIDPEGGPSVNLIPYPPGPFRCVACHALSRDGRYLWASQDSDWQTVMFDLTADLSTMPAPTVYPRSGNFFVATFDPTSRYVVAASAWDTGGWAGPLTMIDARTGLPVPTSGLPTTGTTYPEWSPVGDRLAYVGNVVLGPVRHPLETDIVVAPVLSTEPPSFGPATVLHDGASLSSSPEGGLVDCHPSFSPDGRLLAFQHGPGCFSSFSGTEGAIYVVELETGRLSRLDTAGGGPSSTDTFWPAFSPYTTREADGHRYHWLGFYSRRTYGNGVAGSTGNRQLWVTSIDADRGIGDPSSVPYWLPGQTTTDNNLAAQWAPDACRSIGEGCGGDGECCTGTCLDSLCAPPTSECRDRGETCETSGDCCDMLECTGRRCLEGVF